MTKVYSLRYFKKKRKLSVLKLQTAVLIAFYIEGTKIISYISRPLNLLDSLDVWKRTKGHQDHCYFLRNFYFSPNDRPSKTMKDVFNFIEKALFVLERFKFLYLHLPLFFFLSAIAWELDPRNIKVFDVINCLNKNLIIHFVWYLEKAKRYHVETLAIDTVLNKEHFYGKIMQKMCTKC